MDKIVTEYGTFSSNKNTGETAEQVYKKWKENKDKQIDICPEDKPKTNEELTNENKILNEAVTELTELVSMLMA